MHYKIKIIIIGEAGVGKTSLVKNFVSGQFSIDYRASIGTNMFIKEIDIKSNDDISQVSINLWDIAGQERWIGMRHIYYEGAQGALIVGDVSRKRTFEQIVKFWHPDLIKHCGKIPFILVANKNDLSYEIIKEDVKLIGEKIKASSVIFTSAKIGKNVEKAFELISKHAILL